MSREDWQKILNIRLYCNDIVAFIKRFGRDYDVFINDRAYYNAVSMCILQIGELVNGLSEEFREKTKNEIPWHMIKGMRNWMAHAYAEMDENMIWETAVNDIPGLLKFCDKYTEIFDEEKDKL